MSAEPSTAGSVAGNLASGTVPDVNCVAFKSVMLAPLPVTSPVRLPSKVVDVVTPVTTAPSGKVGETPDVLPLKLVTLKLDIRDLRFEGHQ